MLPPQIKELGLKRTSSYLLTQIYFLSQARGYCYASNSYFAEVFGVSVSTINRSLKTLEDDGFIIRFTCGNRRTIKHNLGVLEKKICQKNDKKRPIKYFSKPKKFIEIEEVGTWKEDSRIAAEQVFEKFYKGVYG